MAQTVIEILDSSEDDAPRATPSTWRRPKLPSRTASQVTDLCSSSGEEDDDAATLPPSSQPVYNDDDDYPGWTTPVASTSRLGFYELEEELMSSPSKRKSNEDHGKARKKRRSAEEVQRDKENKAREREAAKKAKEEEKRRVAAEKKARRDANKLHTSKKAERGDMTLRVPRALATDATFAAVLAALPDAMSDGAPFAIAYDDDDDGPNGEPEVRWERLARATYDAAAREWVPHAPAPRLEPTRMRFVSVAAVARGAVRFPPRGSAGAGGGAGQVLLMVHGPAAGRAAIEPALARAQIAGLLVVPVSDARNAAERIVNITGDIAVRPYKILEMTHLPFARESVPVCPGKGERAAYIHMLAQIPTITHDIAKSIASKFPTFNALIGALERAPNTRAREALFIGLPLSLSNPAGHKLGADRARHLVQLFLAEDPFVIIG